MATVPTKPDAPVVMDVRSVPKLGVLAWSFVGAVAATAIVIIAFGAVSEILLPLLFAAVLAVVFKPVVGKLERRGLKPTLAAGVVVLGLAALMTVVMVATVRGIVQQTDEIGDVTYPGPSPHLSDTPLRLGAPANRPGGDAVSVLQDVGLADAIPALEREWVLHATNLPAGW